MCINANLCALHIQLKYARVAWNDLVQWVLFDQAGIHAMDVNLAVWALRIEETEVQTTGRVASCGSRRVQDSSFITSAVASPNHSQVNSCHGTACMHQSNYCRH